MDRVIQAPVRITAGLQPPIGENAQHSMQHVTGVGTLDINDVTATRLRVRKRHDQQPLAIFNAWAHAAAASGHHHLMARSEQLGKQLLAEIKMLVCALTMHRAERL